MSDETRTGGCLCGNVRYTVRGPMRSVSLCHCGQCRKTSGHVWGSAVAPRSAIDVTGEVTWYRSSETAERGFCASCGSSLFWRMDSEETQSVSLGSMDAPTGLMLEKHIWVASKGDYYTIQEDLPQRAEN